jgi:hypothetical protein
MHSKGKLRLAVAAAALLVSGGVSVAVAPVAAADGYVGVVECGHAGAYRCGYGGSTNNNTRVYSCDTYGDGFGFRVYWENANLGYGWVDDANGSDSGCSAIYPGTVNRIKGCSKRPDGYDVCTAWTRV